MIRAGVRSTAEPRSFRTIRTGAICLFFFEYFHGEDGRGLGASHQGWTALVAKLIQQSYLARDGDFERKKEEHEWRR